MKGQQLVVLQSGRFHTVGTVWRKSGFAVRIRVVVVE